MTKVRRWKKQCIFSKREQHKEEIKSPTHLIMYRCLFNILVQIFPVFLWSDGTHARAVFYLQKVWVFVEQGNVWQDERK